MMDKIPGNGKKQHKKKNELADDFVDTVRQVNQNRFATIRRYLIAGFLLLICPSETEPAISGVRISKTPCRSNRWLTKWKFKFFAVPKITY